MDSAKQISKEELVRKFRTEAILSAARKVIGRDGIHGASLESIARTAGVAKGTIYLYFSNKDDLMSRVVESWHSLLLETIEAAASSDGAPQARLHAVVTAHFEFINTHRDVIRGYFMNVPSSGKKMSSKLFRRLNEINRRCEEIVTEIIDDGIRQGIFRRLDAREAASFLLGILRGDDYRAVLNNDSRDPRDRASELLDLYFYGVNK